MTVAELADRHPAGRADGRPSRRGRRRRRADGPTRPDEEAARCSNAASPWVRSDGSRRAEMPVERSTATGLVSKLEILRGDLVDVLYQPPKTPRVPVQHPHRRPELQDRRRSRCDVHRRIAKQRADLVVGADGPHSTVRRLVFGPEERFVKPLGGYNAWFTAPDTVGLDSWYLMYQAPGASTHRCDLRMIRQSPRRGWLFVQSRSTYDRRDPGAQRTAAGKPVRRRGLGVRCAAGGRAGRR